MKLPFPCLCCRLHAAHARSKSQSKAKCAHGSEAQNINTYHGRQQGTLNPGLRTSPAGTAYGSKDAGFEIGVQVTTLSMELNTKEPKLVIAKSKLSYEYRC